MATKATELSWRAGDLRLLLISTTLCILVVMDANMVALSLPAISGSFQASFQQLEWVISAYMITFAACLLPAGGLADRVGRRKLLLIGLFMFTLASIACGLASSVEMLNTLRALQGVGAALQLTSALAIIAHAFAHRPIAPKAWGVWGTCMGLTTCMSPMIGGVLTELLGWRSIFLINLPLGMIVAWAVYRWVPDSRSASPRRIDYLGSLIFPAALAMLIWALITSSSHGFQSRETLEKVLISCGLFGVFLLVQWLQRQPMVDLHLFRNPRLTAGVVGMFGYSASAQVLLNFFPLYLQTWFDLSPMVAGVSMLPFAAAMVIGPYMGNRVGAGRSAHWLLSAGLVVVCLGNIFTAYLATNPNYLFVAVGMFIIGFGAGMLNGTTQRAIMGEASSENSGMVSGIAQSTRFSSIVLAVGVLGGALSQRAHFVFSSHSTLPTDVTVGSRVLDYVITGNVQGAAAMLDGNSADLVLEAARFSAASGFSLALLIAAAIAGCCSIIIGVLVGERRRVSQSVQ